MGNQSTLDTTPALVGAGQITDAGAFTSNAGSFLSVARIGEGDYEITLNAPVPVARAHASITVMVDGEQGDTGIAVDYSRLNDPTPILGIEFYNFEGDPLDQFFSVMLYRF